MTDSKRNPNPFIRMAQEAKKRKEELEKGIPASDSKPASATKNTTKSSAGFAGTKVFRRSGRGG